MRIVAYSLAVLIASSVSFQGVCRGEVYYGIISAQHTQLAILGVDLPHPAPATGFKNEPINFLEIFDPYFGTLVNTYGGAGTVSSSNGIVLDSSGLNDGLSTALPAPASVSPYTHEVTTDIEFNGTNAEIIVYGLETPVYQYGGTFIEDAAVPEPGVATLATVLLGAAGLVRFHRCRRRR